MICTKEIRPTTETNDPRFKGTVEVRSDLTKKKGATKYDLLARVLKVDINVQPQAAKLNFTGANAILKNGKENQRAMEDIKQTLHEMKMLLLILNISFSLINAGVVTVPARNSQNKNEQTNGKKNYEN